MKTPIDFDAEQIYLSMKGLGTDEDTLSEMIATRPSRRLVKIKDRYPELYTETLENDIKGDTSNYYRNILTAMIQGGRSDNPYPNSQKMKEIVEKLTEDKVNTGPQKQLAGVGAVGGGDDDLDAMLKSLGQ